MSAEPVSTQAPDHRLHPEPQGGVVRRRARSRRPTSSTPGSSSAATPIVPSPDVASIAGYRDIASVTGSNGGHTVTVKFKTTFADWQMLFANLVPAHVMEKVGWNPTCTTVDPAIDLSGGPVQDRHGDAPDHHAGAEPEVVGDAGQRPVHHGPHRLLDGAAGPVDGLGLRAGGAAHHGDAVVPDPDDGAARARRARSTPRRPCCSSTWRARSTRISRPTSGSPSP